MSNHLAIATVTAALGQVVGSAADRAVPGTVIRFGRPTASNGASEKKVHLYLYQVSTNAALFNADTPTRDARGALKQRPQVALNLHYLLSFYGDEQQFEPDRMLGAVVRDLHARPILQREAITNAVASNTPTLDGSDLAEAVERVKFTPEPLSLEEISKVWSVLMQTPHVLSVAYQGNVVLIEAEETAAQPLPVLERGEGDRGVETRVGPFPRLLELHICPPAVADRRPRPASYPHAELGLHLTLAGQSVGGDEVRLRFAHPRRPPLEILVPASDRDTEEIRLVLPNDAAAQAAWAAGIYEVVALVVRGGREQTSNVLPLSLAPHVTQVAPNPAIRDGGGKVTLTLTCQPRILPEQSAVLLLAGREIRANPFGGATDTLTFEVDDARLVQDESVQLRVDGVGSLPFRFNAGTGRLEFDPNQKVTIQ